MYWLNVQLDTKMYQISKNVLFVYGLLLIDLLVNITDNLVPNQRKQNYYWLSSSMPNGGQHLRRVNIISSSTFATILVQILAIICVVISLALRFFDVADRVRQSSWLLTPKTPKSLLSSSGQASEPRTRQDRCQQRPPFVVTPMPQRTALKLVLDRYWWSLVVGLTYLVLTIILQINKIDSQRWPTAPLVGNDRGEGRPTLANSQQAGPNFSREMQPDKGSIDATDETLPSTAAAAETESPELTNQLTDGGSLLPILIVLIHKLMSTCYYVSFVVVYRVSPVQMVNRVLSVNVKQLESTAAGKPLAGD